MTATKNIININIFGAAAHAILCNFHAASEQREEAEPNTVPKRNPPEKNNIKKKNREKPTGAVSANSCKQT